MARICLSESNASEEEEQSLTLVWGSTPAELGGSIPNNDRGIFHIQPANYWSFIDLELINGPYGIFSRDASNNIYDRLRTHDNYESGECLLVL